MHLYLIELLSFLMPRRLLGLAGIGVALVLAGCASSLHRAPVEDRSNSAARAASPTSNAGAEQPSAEVKPPPPGAENAGKPGYYTVKPGDTLIRIGLETGQNWRDIGKWNNIDNPNLIEVGQVVRVLPPGADPNTAAARGVGSGNKLEGKPLDAKPGNAASAPAGVAQANPPAQPASGADDDVSWVWPASGPVIAGFDEARNKGVSISGKAGDPVYAAADGRVVYAGSGLRGYGNLVIIKHNSTYLTAYAHNQSLLVKEDQAVRRGQKIAEMGSTDADRVQLHFEVRKQGRPVDPIRLLPPR